MSGAVYMTGEADQPYRAQVPWVDFGTALHCAFGTSGGQWIYVNERWERDRWFLPYANRTGTDSSADSIDGFRRPSHSTTRMSPR